MFRVDLVLKHKAPFKNHDLSYAVHMHKGTLPVSTLANPIPLED